MGSAPLTQALIDQVRASSPAAITNGYGTTETGPSRSARTPGHPAPELSPGYPHPEVQLRLVRDGREVRDEGELEMDCGALMTGYHNLPEVTAEAMTADGYYRTGDVMRRDEHGFYYLRRPRRRHVRVRRREHLSGRGRAHARAPSRHPAGRGRAVPDEMKGQKPVAFVVRAPGADARRAGGEDLRARQRPGL